MESPLSFGHNIRQLVFLDDSICHYSKHPLDTLQNGFVC